MKWLVYFVTTFCSLSLIVLWISLFIWAGNRHYWTAAVAILLMGVSAFIATYYIANEEE